MDVQLNSWLLFEHAPRHFGTTEVVTHLGPEGVHRYTYTDFARRSQQLMHALDQLGIGKGERVATLAWNSYRHLECYFGIPCTGRILHTLNLRLSPAELGWIIADADDRALFVDRDLVPLLERVPEADRRGVEHIVVLSDLVPESSLPGLLAYEQLLAGTAGELPASRHRRAQPARTLLHVGDDRPPQGSRLHPPLHRPALAGSQLGAPASASARGTASCRRCRCSTSTPGGCPMPGSPPGPSRRSSPARSTPAPSSTSSSRSRSPSPPGCPRCGWRWPTSWPGGAAGRPRFATSWSAGPSRPGRSSSATALNSTSPSCRRGG